MKEFKYNLKLLLIRKEFYIVIIILLLINLVQFCLTKQFLTKQFPVLYYEEIASGEFQSLLINENVLFAAYIVIGFPILSSLIFSDSNYHEKVNRSNIYIHTRLNQKKNILSKWAISILVPFAVIFIILMINCIAHTVVYGMGRGLAVNNYLPYNANISKSFYLGNLMMKSPFLYSTAIIAHVSIFCGLLSGLTNAISYKMKNLVSIHLSIVLLILATSILVSFVQLSQVSILTMLQPVFSYLTLFDAFIAAGILIALNIFFVSRQLKMSENIL